MLMLCIAYQIQCMEQEFEYARKSDDEIELNVMSEKRFCNKETQKNDDHDDLNGWVKSGLAVAGMSFVVGVGIGISLFYKFVQADCS